MSDVGRASVMIGVGTIVSRLTGFIRTVVLVSAVGVNLSAGNAFAVANQLPNNIYTIVSTGLLTAVLVPQIIKAASHKDGGREFLSKLFTLGTVTLIAATALAVLAAPLLVRLYADDFTPAQLALATAFAYWCLPQILFYGLYAMVGETLNARRIYGPYTWAPIVNNVVSIIGFALFIVWFGAGPALNQWSPQMIAVLAGTATLGIVVQAGILFAFWPRTGLRLRPDFRWRGVGLNQIGRLAGWTFLMVLAMQLAGIVQTQVLDVVPDGEAGILVGQSAWLIFMLPYSIIVISIGTPYFTRLAEHASAGRTDEVRADISQSIRVLGLLIVIATAALMVAAVPATRMFTATVAGAQDAALVLVMYLISLLPLSILFVIQRSFYALGDTRTPFWFTLIQSVIVAITAVIAGATLPVTQLMAGVALGQSVAGVFQVIIAVWLLHRRLGGVHASQWMRSLARFALAAVPAAAVGWGTFLLLGGAEGWVLANKFTGFLGTAIICAFAFAVYLGALAVLRAPELTPALTLLRRLLPRR